MKIYTPPPPLFSIRVKVPASTANLGAGFDVLGLSLGYYNEMEVTAWDDKLMPPASVQIDGEGADELPLDRTNLAHQAARRAIEKIGRPIRALRIKLINRIPLARGLGSSSTAIVGGILGVNAGLGRPLSVDDMLDLAVEMEGHPDNILPALVGGLCVGTLNEGRVQYLSWTDKKIFKGLRAVMGVPYFKLSTRRSREVLPAHVSREDAIFTSSRTALCLGALLDRRHDLLAVAMEDRFHQPYRKDLVPGLEDALVSARKAGAWGSALSGAGPSILALCPPKAVRRVAEAMSDAFRRHEVTSLWMDLEVGVRGAQAFRLRHGKPTKR